jgi:hypothetical protein
MFLMLPKGCSVLTVPGELARFVFTAPVAVEKNPAAVTVESTKSTSGFLAGMKAEKVDEPEAQKSTSGRLEGVRGDFV